VIVRTTQDDMKNKSASFEANQNRTFGLVMAGCLGGLALGRFLWVGAITWWLIWPATLFLAMGLLVPAWLGPVRAGWMKFAAALGYVNSRILLTIVFVGLIVPTALVLRLLGRQPIRLGFREGAVSYWRRRTADEFAAGRMERQF
jgi:hypothetical protein